MTAASAMAPTKDAPTVCPASYVSPQRSAPVAASDLYAGRSMRVALSAVLLRQISPPARAPGEDMRTKAEEFAGAAAETGFDNPAEADIFKRGAGKRIIDAAERVVGVIRADAEIRPRVTLS